MFWPVTKDNQLDLHIQIQLPGPLINSARSLVNLSSNQRAAFAAVDNILFFFAECFTSYPGKDDWHDKGRFYPIWTWNGGLPFTLKVDCSLPSWFWPLALNKFENKLSVYVWHDMPSTDLSITLGRYLREDMSSVFQWRQLANGNSVCAAAF